MKSTKQIIIIIISKCGPELIDKTQINHEGSCEIAKTGKNSNSEMKERW